jgi:hypothetical protein
MPRKAPADRPPAASVAGQGVDEEVEGEELVREAPEALPRLPRPLGEEERALPDPAGGDPNEPWPGVGVHEGVHARSGAQGGQVAEERAESRE